MSVKKIAYYALTSKGHAIVSRLAAKLGGTVYASRRLEAEGAAPFDSLSELIAATFNTFDAHVFVAAAGIAVRCIAPHLQSKETDPAVVCLDQDGQYAVSLLAGHLGGANELSTRCARVLDGQPVITTATDSVGVLSIDMLAQSRGLVIADINRVKFVNIALLEGLTVQLHDPEDWLGLAWDMSFEGVSDPDDWDKNRPGIWVTWHDDCPQGALCLHPRMLHLGVGCRLDVSKEEITDHVHAIFKAKGLALKSIASLGSVEAKRHEAGLLEAAHEFGVDPVFYSTKQLASIDVPTPSNMVLAHMNVSSVAEASALLATHGGELVVTKEKTSTVTLAVARAKGD